MRQYMWSGMKREMLLKKISHCRTCLHFKVEKQRPGGLSQYLEIFALELGSHYNGLSYRASVVAQGP